MWTAYDDANGVWWADREDNEGDVTDTLGPFATLSEAEAAIERACES